MTFEEILREKMSVELTTTGKDGVTKKVTPMEAMVNAVIKEAMKGNIGAIMFIRSMTERTQEDDEATQNEQTELVRATVDELSEELKSGGLQPAASGVELLLLAQQLVTLRRIARVLNSSSHRDILVTPQKDGSERTELSPANRVYNDLYKQWRSDWAELKQGLYQQKMMRR